MKWTAVVAAFFGVALAAPAGALAAGGPVSAVQGRTGVGVPGSPVRFVALPMGSATVVERVKGRGQRVRSRLRISGRYGVPGADFNGSTTGLSWDGRTLVLEQIRRSGAAPRTTRLLVLGTQPLRVRNTINLPGWSTVDAISPDGHWMYLIHYRGSDISKYEVLAYDLARGRLLTKPIVDPHDRGEAMTGIPMRRLMSPDGRWAYTFYGRPSGEPFVHALDTTGVRAVCVDLPSLSGSDFGAAHLRLGPGATTLQISIGGAVRAVINTRTFKVSSGVPAKRAAPTRPAAQGKQPGNSASGVPWGLVVPFAALAALAFAFWRLPRRRAA